jgi:hypothetical protein
MREQEQRKQRPHEIAREIARDILKRGWHPVPVPPGLKSPTDPNWQLQQITLDNVNETFRRWHGNVGVQFGKVSGGLTDVDLDCVEALALADTLLPDTNAIFGRKSKRRSHRLYITDLCESENKAWLRFVEPRSLARVPGKLATLVELRIGGGDKGAQTLFPGSEHPSGELIEWEVDGGPAQTDGAKLKRVVGAIAAGALLARNYPHQGARHEAALVLGGVLARIPDMEKNEIEFFVSAIARIARDEQAEERGRSAAGAVDLLKRNEPTPGLPRMREVWGEELTKTVAKWLGYGADSASARHVGGTPADNQTNQLIALADEAELFHSKEGVPYADVLAKGHRETWLVTSKGSGGFAQWLRYRFYEATGGAPNSQSLTSALNTLAAKARYDGPVHEVYVRLAAVDDRIYLDLCDEDWHVIEIDANGWGVIEEPPVRFLRRRGMMPMPMPAKHSRQSRRKAVDKLYDYVNVATEEDFCLLVSYLLAALSGRGPFVVLVLMGEPGTAKSTLARILKELVDPNKAPLRAPPREARDMFVAANNSYLIAFDNFSDLPDWLSDMLCRLSTGGGFGTRQLYTDEDEMLFDAMRPVVLTCVDNVIIRGDLSDRTIFLTLLSIPENKRRHQREFWAAFDRDKPAILGALLDIVSRGLRELPYVKLTEYPRMADFAEFATACEKGSTDALWKEGLFADAYAMNRASAAQSVIDEDLVANAIRRLMAKRDAWEGGAASLLADLNELVSETIKQHKNWPKAANALSRRMNKASGVLRKIGIELEGWFAEKTNRRIWRITRHNTP